MLQTNGLRTTQYLKDVSDLKRKTLSDCTLSVNGCNFVIPTSLIEDDGSFKREVHQIVFFAQHDMFDLVSEVCDEHGILYTTQEEVMA